MNEKAQARSHQRAIVLPLNSRRQGKRFPKETERDTAKSRAVSVDCYDTPPKAIDAATKSGRYVASSRIQGS
jgi:hypothetical protein